MCGRIVQGRHDLASSRVVAATLQCQCPLSDGRQHETERQQFGNMHGESQSPQARFGQNQDVEIALLEFAEPSLHVAADILHLQVRAGVQQLGPSPQAARADARPGRQPQKGAGGFFFSQGRRIMRDRKMTLAPFFSTDQRVGGGSPLRYGGQNQSRRHAGRQVLEAVNGQIDPTVEQSPLDFLGENAFSADVADRGLLLVAGGGDGHKIHRHAALSQLRGNPLGLPAGQRAGPGSESKGQKIVFHRWPLLSRPASPFSSFRSCRNCCGGTTTPQLTINWHAWSNVMFRSMHSLFRTVIVQPVTGMGE